MTLPESLVCGGLFAVAALIVAARVLRRPAVDETDEAGA